MVNFIKSIQIVVKAFTFVSKQILERMHCAFLTVLNEQEKSFSRLYKIIQKLDQKNT